MGGRHRSGRARSTCLLLSALLSTAALLAGCGGDGSASRLSTTVDTVAGAVHIEYSGALPDRRVEPVVEVGRVGGLSDGPFPDEFGRVVRVIGDDAGRIYVADQMPPEIRVFDDRGQHLRTLGGRGGGPGELGGLHGMAWLARDTMIVADFGNARLSVLTAAGEAIGQWPWIPITGASRRFLHNGGPGEAYAYVLAPREGSTGRMESAWARYTLTGEPDTLRIPDAESLGLQLPVNQMLCRGGNGIGVMRNEYGPEVIAKPAPSLERAVAVSSAYRIAFLAPDGDTLRVIARDVEPLPMPDSIRSAVEASRDTFVRDWRGADCEGEIAWTDVLPVLRGLFFDHQGRLLVEYNRSDGAAFDLFDRDGQWIASFPAPARDPSVPPYLHGDRLYTATRDSLDVQRVRVHRVVAPEQ